MSARYRAIGALCVAVGAMLFACKGLLAKFAYARGVQFETLVTLRAVLSLPLFWAFTLSRESPAVLRATRPGALVAAAVAGFLCYYVGALVDFYALTMIDASVERTLLFSYPAMVVALSSILTRTRPSGAVVGATCLTYVGIFFAVGGFHTDVVRQNLVGAGFVLTAALSYAIYFMVGERYTREIGSGRFTLIAMSAATVALLMHFSVAGHWRYIVHIDATSWSLLVLLAVLCMFVPALLQAEGVRRIGAQRGAVLSTVGPPTAVVFAWLLLGERMTWMQLAGVALIVSGILALDLERNLRAARAIVSET